MVQKALPELTIADVFITDELDRRAPKKTDYLQEKLALQDLAARMVDQPEEVLPRFVDLALEMTDGVSAGLSLYEEEPAPGVFRWQYLRGVLAPFNGATTPRDFSPCGITLDRNAPVLSRHPERVYGWIADANIVVPEVLLVPLYLGGRVPLGTLWIVSAREGHFDSGHARALTELAAFVGIALRMVRSEQRLNTALEAQARAAEVTLRSSEEQFRRLVQGVTDYSLYMLTPDGKVASWNAGAERIKGYTPDEIIGQHFSRFYTEEDRQNGEPERALATAIREGRFEKEGWRLRKNGERFWANVIIDAIREGEGEGEIIGFAKITRDITEQREARVALDRARETLFQSQKMEAVGQLTGGIAHDFNNLLTAIIGSLEIAERRVSDNSVKRLINNAMRGAQRGAALTQRMLVFARRHELNAQPLDIQTLVRNMSEMLERSLGPSVLIETRFPLNLPWVKTDPNQLEMALLNLMVNARDAMPQGGPVIVAARSELVGNGKQLRPGSYVCVSVTDTGEGMDEATLSKAMDPFFTTKEVGKGTGLGLPMVHGLAQESDGALVLKSKKGQGTTAELWLPVAGKSSVVAKAAEVEAPTPINNLTVVVVDDDPLVLTNMAAMLDDLGHTVFEAASARDALAILRRESTIQLVVTDQAMPQMTGLQLIEEIKSGWPTLPVILATGFAELPSDTDPLHITLAKPFLQYDLEQAVKAALEDPKPRRVVRFRRR